MTTSPSTSMARAHRLGKRLRQGTASIEFAVCLPVLMALVLGVIEVSNAVFIQQALTSSAYEAANVASAFGGTATNATSRANAVLTSLGVTSSTVTISPAVTASTPLGTTIVVTCSAPLSSNSLTFGYLGNRTLSARITIPRL